MVTADTADWMTRFYEVHATLTTTADPGLMTQRQERLMRELGNADALRRQRLALIGLRGAGKTTLGSLLAKDLHAPFIELDQEIEREAGLPLSEIFTLYGQAGYRRLERRCLERVLSEHDRAVIAVGGGVVSEEDTFNLLLTQCHTVWLKARPEEHMARVVAQGDLRPMADDRSAMAELRNILVSREPLYARASAVVDTAGLNVSDAAARLIDAVAPVLHDEARMFARG